MSEVAPWGSERQRRWLLFAAYPLLNFFSFPQELPLVGLVDLGTVTVWFVPVALLLGIDDATPREALRRGGAASLLAHSIFFYWFLVVTLGYAGMPLVVGVLAPILPALYVSLFTCAFLWIWSRFIRGRSGSIVFGAAAWVALDWVRAHFLGGFPWATLGYALHGDLPLVAWTQFGGVYVLSFVGLLGGIALIRVIRCPACRRARIALGATAAAVAGLHLVGWWIMDRAGEARAPTRALKIAAIQGNIAQDEKWDAKRREDILSTYLRLSRRAAADGADWIVWPESAIPGLVEHDASQYERIAQLARKHGARLVLGGVGAEVDLHEQRISAFYDSAFLFDATGELRDRYDKTHLVPFGEYVPLRAFLGRIFQAVATGLSELDVTPGTRPRNLYVMGPDPEAPPLQVGVPICYELLFPHLVRRFAGEGASVLLAITNDAWYGRTGAPHQFLAMTAIRAAESRRPVVRAANTGISAWIDGSGRVRRSTELFEEAVMMVDVDVDTSGRTTFYARFGDVFAALCGLGTLGIVFGRGWLERGSRRQASNGRGSEG